jgi:1-acyl-sn-glycerol-3-phosphate acyltransferase
MRGWKKRRSGAEFYEKVHGAAAKWAKSQLKWAGVSADVKGLEGVPEGAVLFAANHQSDFDAALFLALVSRPVGFIAKLSVKNIPIVRTVMRYMGCVFVDRADPRQQLRAILEGIEIIKGGHSLVVFPEGTRSKDGAVAEFKAGSFKLATKSGVPVIPVTIDGSRDVFENNGGMIKKTRVAVTFHPPVYVSRLSREEQAGLHAVIRDTVSSELGAWRGGRAGA